MRSPQSVYTIINEEEKAQIIKEKVISKEEKKRLFTKQRMKNNWIARQNAIFVAPTVTRATVRTGTLNIEQRRALRVITRHHNNRDVNKDPLLFRLEGTAGTGKSYVINAMLDIIPKEQVYVAAPTGKAANNIGGSTLHSLLHLMNPEEMKGQQLKMMQNKFKQIRYLIIDEYSMVGALMLNKIDRRLRQATGKAQELFGGISIILAGDFKQLPPVW